MSIENTASNETLYRSKEALLSDLKRVVHDADELLVQMSDATVDEFSSVRHGVEAKISEAKAKLENARTVFTRKACGVADATNEYISANPGKVIGIASLFGLLTALLLLRRSQK